jgi:Na+-translocating ferredoxin:NAD+ oxidoreductase subunit B
MADLAARLHAALPQTQCTRCGYPDCAAYAQALADNTANINQCPPGGAEGVLRLAALTGRPVLLLNPENGVEAPRHMAVIDEDWCIGCTLCLDACPTDAIVGGNKRMHTVIEAYCTGCELCIPVCPVDCIALENVTGAHTGWQAWSATQARQALDRYKLHSERVSREAGLLPKTPETDAFAAQNTASTPPAAADPAQRKRAVIDAALARARQRNT